MDKKPLVGLGVLIFNNRNEILLGKRKGSHGEFTWGPPGGHLEFGESFEECAAREVLEETGLEIKNSTFLVVTNDFFQKENKHYISIFMKADYPEGQTIKNNESHKTEEWKWFSLKVLPENLFLPLEQLVSDKGYGARIMNTKAA